MFLPKQNPNCGLLDRRAVTVCADLLVYKSEMSQSYQMKCQSSIMSLYSFILLGSKNLDRSDLSGKTSVGSGIA